MRGPGGPIAEVSALIEVQFLADAPARDGVGGVARAFAAVLAMILPVAMSGCIEGGRISATIPAGFFADVIADADTGGGEVGAPDADAVGDADATTDAGDADGADAADVLDAAEVGPDVCVPGTPGCEATQCTVDADCITLDDGNLCNGRFVCTDKVCVSDPTPVTCPLDNSVQCYANTCDPASGLCAKQPKADGSICTDLEACTAEDHCIAGVCVAGKRISCDDGDPCTDDSCSNGGCIHVANTSPCDDGNPCTKADACDAGRCVGGQSVCACVGDDDCAEFDDGNACNGTLSCVGGFCRATAKPAVVCPASTNPCADSRCNPASGACEPVSKPDGVGCTDGNACTVGDVCAGGVCTGQTLDCSGGACGIGGCDPESGCTRTPVADGTACAGVSGCLEGGTCAEGACAPDPAKCECEVDADCAAFDDADRCNGTLVCAAGRCALDPTTVVICKVGPGEQCKQAACVPATGVCNVTNRPTGSACSDGNACTMNDACQAGMCQGQPMTCTGADACNEAVCDFFTGCKTRPKGVACAASDVCVAAAGCASGVCENLAQVSCPAGSECADSACDPARGGCVTVPLAVACSDGDPCTEGDTCLGGECRGAKKRCDDKNPCTLDACGGDGACTHEATSAAVCDDGNACTVGDVCDAGSCVGTALAACSCSGNSDCADFEDGDLCNGTLVCDGGTCKVDPTSVVTCDAAGQGPCVANRCEPSTGQCAPVALADGLACKSGDACMTDGACQAGACVGKAVDCDDANPCTTDACDAVLGCTHGVKEGSCDDGNPCTPSSACSAGVCVGASNTCTCSVDADCASKEDGDACNGKLRCRAGRCEVDPKTVVTCETSANPCVSTACEPASGKCVETAKTGACEDGNPCTTGDTCTNKVCVGGAAKQCTATSSCATSSCDVTTGACVSIPKSGSCNDQNPCTSGDTCTGGACVGAQNNCPCTLDEDCDDDITNKCLGTAVCGLAGCELLAGSAVTCSAPTDTPCSFLACDAESGACAPTTLATGTTCQPPGKCFQPGSCAANGSCTAKPLSCDDKNPCTADSCDPAIGCVNTPLAEKSSCDDGDPCTAGTRCQSGQCAGGLFTCQCGSQADCDKLPVADRCNGTYTCTSGTCRLSGPVVCAPTGKEPCLLRSCNSASGTCTLSQAPGGTPCNDNDACTSNDRCNLDMCIGTPKACGDANPCTDDTCEAGQCVNSVKDSGFCDDADPCTANTVCSAGVCGGGTFQCACTSDANCKVFDDGNACNGIWKCVSNICEPAPGSEITCSDPNPFDCIDVACNTATGACTETIRAKGMACNDGSVCTTADVCDAFGGCAGVDTVKCDDPNPNDCEVIACDPKLGACVAKPKADGAACTDDDACTTGDACVAGACHGARINCDDDKPCTVDTCSSTSGCQNAPAFGACDDGDPCTGGTICVNSICQNGMDICGCAVHSDCDFLESGDLCGGDWKCVTGHCQLDPGTVVTCPASPNPCVVATCANGTCSDVPVADNEPCSDGDACTVDDACVAGVCVSGEPLCDDKNPCTTDTCDAGAGTCTHVRKADQTICDDRNACNGVDSCQFGVCVSGTAAVCDCVDDADCAAFDDGDLCNGSLLCSSGKCVINPQSVVVCPLDPSGCAPQTCDPLTGSCGASVRPNGTPCNDGDPCTVSDRCEAGVCAGTAKTCDDSNPCTSDACAPYFGCVHAAIAGPCDDGNPCTIDEVCTGGACVGVPNTCDDGNPCTKDECLASQGCRYTNESASKACDDGNPCTSGDRCGGGKCNPLSQLCGCTNVSQCTPNLCLGPVACVAGQCIYDSAAKVTCPKDTACASFACEPATGACVETPAADGAGCSDGNVCTTGDSCVGGQCVSTGTTSCQGNPSPCIQAVCDPIAGCQDTQVAASCDDSQSCTIDDQCVAGACRGIPAASPHDAFDTGDLTAWTFATTAEDVQWQLTGARKSSPPLALGVFDADKGSLADAGGAWVATATRVAAEVPVGLPAGVATLRLLLRMDVGETTCFRALVDDALVFERCAATTGFIPVNVSLGDAGGKDVVLQLEVEETSATSTGTGVYVDDVIFDWACLLK